MREPRNPFLMRTSEHIESDATFIRLFGKEVLDFLQSETIWGQVQIIRSSPGAGKTSLFRLFTPSVLIQLFENRDNEEYRELFQSVKKLDVFSKTGPKVVGLLLPCSQSYAMLHDVNTSSTQQERLFNALINSRLTLNALRSICVIKSLDYPTDLSSIDFLLPQNVDVPSYVPIPGNGRDLYEWAREAENAVCKVVDSFAPISTNEMFGHDAITAFNWIDTRNIRYKETQIAEKTLVMFDDVHKLTSNQRNTLLEQIMDARPSVNIWLSERLEALNPYELLSPGATTGREYGEPLYLEEYWRKAAHTKKFEKAVENIANRRLDLSREVRITGPFATCLQTSLESRTYDQKMEAEIKKTSSRIIKRIEFTNRYNSWINTKKASSGNLYDDAIAWRRLEILVERDLSKAQLSFDFMLSQEELEKRDASSVKAAAEFFVSRSAGIPYYFGMSRLANLASSNIEQFLAFAGELFEECISAELMGRSHVLTPQRQEAIFKRVSKQRWEEIPRKVAEGRQIQRFLEKIGEFARLVTLKPTASYSPGMTGIAITMEQREKLIGLKNVPKFQRLANTLANCIAYNWLEVSLDKSQGQKNKTWMILYLNRWLCLHFDLPLHYGSWRPRSLEQLCEWNENLNENEEMGKRGHDGE
jgi:hypothetical protein